MPVVLCVGDEDHAWQPAPKERYAALMRRFPHFEGNRLPSTVEFFVCGRCEASMWRGTDTTGRDFELTAPPPPPRTRSIAMPSGVSVGAIYVLSDGDDRQTISAYRVTAVNEMKTPGQVVAEVERCDDLPTHAG